MNRISNTVLLLALAGALAGCKSSEIKGGSTQRRAADFTVEVGWDEDGAHVEVTDNRESAATTQPSVVVKGSDSAPRLGPTTQPDEFGGYSYDFAPQLRKTFADRHAKWLAGIFLLCALACFAMRKWVYGVTCLAIGVLAALHPTSLAIGAIVVLAGTLYIGWRNIKQLGRGIKEADKQTPPDIDIAGIVRQEVDRSTQQMVGIAKPPTAPPQPGETQMSGVVVGKTGDTNVEGTIHPTGKQTETNP